MFQNSDFSTIPKTRIYKLKYIKIRWYVPMTLKYRVSNLFLNTMYRSRFSMCFSHWILFSDGCSVFKACPPMNYLKPTFFWLTVLYIRKEENQLEKPLYILETRLLKHLLPENCKKYTNIKGEYRCFW